MPCQWIAVPLTGRLLVTLMFSRSPQSACILISRVSLSAISVISISYNDKRPGHSAIDGLTRRIVPIWGTRALFNGEVVFSRDPSIWEHIIAVVFRISNQSTEEDVSLKQRSKYIIMFTLRVPNAAILQQASRQTRKQIMNTADISPWTQNYMGELLTSWCRLSSSPNSYVM